MAEYLIGDQHWKGDPIGNIRVLSEPVDADTVLRYLIRDENDRWGWWAGSNPEVDNKHIGFDSFEEARGFGRERMYVSAIQEPVSVRAQVLRKAEEIVSKDRNSSYGEPEDNFARIAAFWNTFLGPKFKDGEEISTGDTAVLMILVKLAREMNAPTLDNKIDIAGYAACLAQVDHPTGE